MELQGREVRIVFGRSKRDAQADVHDADERVALGKAGDDRANQSFPNREGFGDRCLVELSSEEKNQAIQAAAA